MSIKPFVPFNPELTLKHISPFSHYASVSDEESDAYRRQKEDYKQLKSHLEIHFGQHLTAMTSSEHDALTTYTDDAHRAINDYFNNGASDTDHVTQNTAETLRGAIHRVSLSAPLVHPMHTFTGMTSSQDVDPGRSSKMHQMIARLSPGQTVRLSGFTSSSPRLATPVDFSKDMIKYGAGIKSPPSEEHRHIAAFLHPAGSSAGAFIERFSTHQGEDEHLMKPGVGLVFKGTTKTSLVMPRSVRDAFHPKNNLWFNDEPETDEQYAARHASPKVDVPTIFHFHHFDVEK